MTHRLKQNRDHRSQRIPPCRPKSRVAREFFANPGLPKSIESSSSGGSPNDEVQSTEFIFGRTWRHAASVPCRRTIQSLVDFAWRGDREEIVAERSHVVLHISQVLGHRHHNLTDELDIYRNYVTLAE